jgi:hypothetical protein
MTSVTVTVATLTKMVRYSFPSEDVHEMHTWILGRNTYLVVRRGKSGVCALIRLQPHHLSILSFGAI